MFAVMIVSSLVMLIINNPNAVLSTALSASGSGVQLAITLMAIYIFWMGLVQVAIDSGLVARLAKLMRPINRWLFGKQTDEVDELLATNISANMIGAGGAATPAAIDAIEKMAEPEQKKASIPMIMLFVVSATSMQLIPTTIVGILQRHGAENASFVILPTFIVSTVTTLIGVLIIKFLAKHADKRVSKRNDKIQSDTQNGRQDVEVKP